MALIRGHHDFDFGMCEKVASHATTHVLGFPESEK